MSQDQFAVFSTYRRVISRNTEEVLFFAKHIMLPSSRRRAPRPGKTPLTEEGLFFTQHIKLPSSRRRTPWPGKTPLTEESLFFAKQIKLPWSRHRQQRPRAKGSVCCLKR